jgi:hypothetical protein
LFDAKNYYLISIESENMIKYYLSCTIPIDHYL